MKIKLKRRPKGLRINYHIFESFLLSTSLFLLLLSFAFDKTGVIIVNALALLTLLWLTAKRGIVKTISKEFFNLDLSVSLAMLILFCLGGYYQAVVGMQIYYAVKLVFNTEKFLVPKISDVLKKMKNKKYHIILSSETVVREPSEINEGDLIELYSGETVPVDCVVKAGSGTVNTVNITGESKIVSVGKRDKIKAGYTLLTGNVILEAESTFNTSLVKKACEDISEACKINTRGERIQNHIFDALSIVIFIAGVVFAVVKYVGTGDFDYIKYLIPASIIASSLDPVKKVIPDTYRSALYRCISKGMVIKSKSFIEKTLSIKGIFFETRGVLTTNESVVLKVCPTAGISETLFVKLTAYGQYKAGGSFLNALVKYGKIHIDNSEILSCEKFSSTGQVVTVKNDIEIITGTSNDLKDKGILNPAQNKENILCTAINGTYVGHIEFETEVKQDIRQCIDSLRFAGIKNIAILTEEINDTVNDIAIKGGIDKIYSTNNTAQLQEIKRTIADSSVLFASSSSEFDGGFNIIKYSNKEDSLDNCVWSDNLMPPVNYVNIIKDCKVVMFYNFILGLVAQIIGISMVLNSTKSIWLMLVFIMVFKILQKLNCINLIHKI